MHLEACKRGRTGLGDCITREDDPEIEHGGKSTSNKFGFVLRCFVTTGVTRDFMEARMYQE